MITWNFLVFVFYLVSLRPTLTFALTSAPISTKYFTISKYPFSQARNNAVLLFNSCPLSLGFSFI